MCEGTCRTRPEAANEGQNPRAALLSLPGAPHPPGGVEMQALTPGFGWGLGPPMSNELPGDASTALHRAHGERLHHRRGLQI